jgi:hypothetical protein
MHDPGDVDELLQDGVGGLPVDHGSLSQRSPGQAEKQRSESFRDELAKEMWAQYQAVLQERGEGGTQEYLHSGDNEGQH